MAQLISNLPNPATWTYQADITNGAGGAGTQTYTITPGDRAYMDFLYGQVFQGDTVGRVITVAIDDGATNELTELMRITGDAASRHSIPHSDVADAAGTHLSAGASIRISGAMDLIVTIAAVAASQDTAFGCACTIYGALPTASEVGASTPTINVNQEGIQ